MASHVLGDPSSSHRSASFDHYLHFDRIWYINLDVGQGVSGAHKEVLREDSFRKGIDFLYAIVSNFAIAK